MPVTFPKLYLPVAETTVSQLLDGAAVKGDILPQLSVPEISALLIIQSLHKLDASNLIALTERALSQTIRAFNELVQTRGSADFITQVSEVLDPKLLRQGFERLDSYSLCCLDAADVAGRSYLDAQGQWDFTFRERHRPTLLEYASRLPGAGRQALLTDQQARIYAVAAADLDDHLHVQGYAGTGKSYLIRALLQQLRDSGGRILVLAERWPQLQALIAAVADKGRVTAKTFGQLASAIMPHDLTSAMHLRMRQGTQSFRQIDDSVYINFFGIKASGSLSARDVVRVSHATVTSFCNSSDSLIEERHIPKRYAIRDEVTKVVIVKHAREFWAALIDPDPSFDPPVRGYHQVKYAALHQWKVPRQYTHVVIDECHNLSKALMQILERSSQPVYTLGDEYQRLRGIAQYRSNNVRERNITCSVRGGKSLESIVNPIIGAHPGRTKDHFEGNRWNRTVVTQYQKLAVPTEPTTILVADCWRLFEWAQRLGEKGEFRLLSNAKDLGMFVQDLVELYHNDIRGRHGELFRFGSWEELATRRHADSTFQRVESLLARGYSHQDWLRTATRFENITNAAYALGRVEDVRNQEYESVMLTPELLRDLADDSTPAEMGSALYVAVTRTSRRLIVPETFRHWIEEIAGGRGASTRLEPELPSGSRSKS